MRKPIPIPPRVPTGGAVMGWISSITAYLQSTQDQDGTNPVPIQLAALTPDAKAATDGILMFDRVAQEVVVSSGGVWVPL